MYIENWQTQLRKGLLDVVILNLLSHGPCHGYEMVKQLRKIEGLNIREGNIYPILVRLEEDALVKSCTESSTDGPPRKYFKLTGTGKEVLDRMNMHWDRMVNSIGQVKQGDFQ